MSQRPALTPLLFIALAGCSSLLPSPDDASVRAQLAPPTAIKHIVVIVQENHSFESIFAGYPNADAPMYGFTHNGTRVNLHPVTFTAPTVVFGTYSLQQGIADWDRGKMDRFDLTVNQYGKKVGNFPYAYLVRSSVKPYWSMAQQYVLADRMFPTQWGSSWTAHLDLIAGTTRLSRDEALADVPSALPWGCDAPKGTTTNTWSSRGAYGQGPFPCFDRSNSLFGSRTIAYALDSAGVSWKYYAPTMADFGGQAWSAFDEIAPVRYGPDWAKVDSPQTNVLRDVRDGKLPAVSWVIPDWADSDHAGSTGTGPSWVSAVVNAVGQSPYWNSTAIVVLWDDWGGWYDNVPPPQVDFIGLGIRVPCVVISPYAKAGFVSHTQYEFGSVLKFIEQTFGLASLGFSDARANSLVDTLDFTQTPRTFVPIAAPYPASHFLHEMPSGKPPDDM